MKLHKIALTPPLAAISAVLFTAFAAVAATINVPGDYADIASALANASADDTVEVAAGTYSVSAAISIPTGVTLVAPEGPEKTEIKSTGTQDDVVVVDGANLFGFAVSDAKGKYAVRILNNGVVSNCVIRNATLEAKDFNVAVLVTKGTLVRSVVTNTVVRGGFFSDLSGSAVRLASGLVDSCVIAHNSGKNTRADVHRWYFCAAVYLAGGTLRNSLIADNYSNYNATGVQMAGAATIDGCTIVGNYNPDKTDTDAAGLCMTANGTVVNTLIWGNTNADGDLNVYKTCGTMTFCCTTPAVSGEGNISDAPNFFDAEAGDYRLGFCGAIDAATPRGWHEGALDLAGEGRVFGNGPDIGCYESHSADLGCDFSVDLPVGTAPHKVTATATCSAGVEGTTFKWYFTGGDEPDVTMVGEATAEWTYDNSEIGVHDVCLVVENGGSTGTMTHPAAVTVGPAVCYVDCENAGNSEAPYLTPATAATNILDAVSIAVKGAEIRVAKGTYLQSQAISLTEGVTLVAEDGPEKTEIKSTGAQDDVVRVDGAKLVGFAVSGATGMRAVYVRHDGVVSNCVVRNSTFDASSYRVAVLVEQGTFVRSVVTNTVISGSKFLDTSGSAVRLEKGLVDSCIITHNSSQNSYGKGVKSYHHGAAVYLAGGTLRNSLIADNYSQYHAMGVDMAGGGARVENCTIVRNYNLTAEDADSVGLELGSGRVVNSIVWGNENQSGVANVKKASGTTMTYSCTTPEVEGSGNISSDPLFRDFSRRSCRLRASSPCVDAGDNSAVSDIASAKDLSGHPRLHGAIVDLGCYENQAEGVLLFIR